jgi:glycosyltransferase involved in cell wall biosynthesis
MDVPLKVFGNGSEHAHLKQLAGPTVEFFTNRFGDASDQAVTTALNGARGFIYPSEEDFGIVSVEALAAGAPVIAYGKGGALDIVQDGESGVLFDAQTPEAVIDALKRAETIDFKPGTLRRKAKRFDRGLFITKMRTVVLKNLEKE